MRKAFLSLILMCPVAVPLTSTNKHQPRPLCLIQPTSPLGLESCLTDYDSDLLKTAKVKNASQHPITSYRIGWMAFLPFGKTKVGLGDPVHENGEIPQGVTARVPPQAISPKVGQDASAVAFFVTEIHLTTREIWNADLKEVNREAKQMKKKPPMFSDVYSQ